MPTVQDIDTLVKAGDHAGALALAQEAIADNPNASVFFVRALTSAVELGEIDLASDLAKAYPIRGNSALNGYFWSFKVAMALIKRDGFDAGLAFWQAVSGAYLPFVDEMRAAWPGPHEILSYTKRRLYEAYTKNEAQVPIDAILAFPGELGAADVHRITESGVLSDEVLEQLLDQSPQLSVDAVLRIRAVQGRMKAKQEAEAVLKAAPAVVAAKPKSAKAPARKKPKGKR